MSLLASSNRSACYPESSCHLFSFEFLFLGWWLRCPDECVHAFDAVSTGADPHLPRRHWQHGYGEGQAESAGCAARPRLAAMAEVLKVGGAEETVVDLTEDGAPLRGFAERKRATDLLSCYPAHLSCCRTRTKLNNGLLFCKKSDNI
uniref:Uncharacterized protein n=1 Tax=Aegilops tauschii subsp. strangulata TaxID=200361 RepID=A0A453C422_AEGTS